MSASVFAVLLMSVIVISTERKRVEKSQKIKQQTRDFSVRAFASLVCGFPKGALRKVASLRSSAVSTQFVEPRQGSASLAHAE